MSSSSDKKTIQFNPDLFKIPDKRSTRKRSTEPKEIKVRGGKTSRTHLIRQIRNLQEERYKRMQENSNSGEYTGEVKPASSIADYSSPSDDFESDFDHSLQFLKNMVEQEKSHAAASPPPHNGTLRNSHPIPPPNYSQTYDLGVSSPHNYEIDLEVPAELNHALSTPPIKLTPRPPAPQWGAMKNGNLPTYRGFHNMTQRNTPSLVMAAGGAASHNSHLGGGVGGEGTQHGGSVNASSQHNGSMASPASELMNQIKMHNAVKSSAVDAMPKRPKKQKRIVKRTFRVGKSKVYPRVGVLVANKTIRNDLATRLQEIKQTPIEKVKRDLIKRGLIKVGSSAPNDVLRKMYESVSMVCGEVQNHNSENLLYNYLNSDMI